MGSGARKLLAFSILVGGLGLAWLVRPSGQGFGFAPAGSGRLILRKEAPPSGVYPSGVSWYPLLPGIGKQHQSNVQTDGGKSGNHSMGGGSQEMAKVSSVSPPVLPPRFPSPQAEGTFAPLLRPANRPSVRRHRLVDGDSLEKLAERYLGSATLADQIYQANRSLLPDPHLLPIGVEIIIPAAEPIRPISVSELRAGKLVPLPEVSPGDLKADGTAASAAP